MQPTEAPIQASAVRTHEPPQGCLKIAALTAARLLVHMFVLLIVLSVLVSPVGIFMKFYEEENLKLPAATLLIINMSYRMRFHAYLILPVLILVDAAILTALQLLPRPWRFLARVWFAGVLVFAFLLMAWTVFAMALPIDRVLPVQQQTFPEEPAIEAAPTGD